MTLEKKLTGRTIEGKLQTLFTGAAGKGKDP